MQVHALGPEDGTLARFEDRGGRFEEEEGFLRADVVELFDVVAFCVSAERSTYTTWVNLWRRRRRAVTLGDLEGTESIRIISTDTDNFAAAGRNATRGHFILKKKKLISLQLREKKRSHRLSLTPRQIPASIIITTNLAYSKSMRMLGTVRNFPTHSNLYDKKKNSKIQHYSSTSRYQINSY